MKRHNWGIHMHEWAEWAQALSAFDNIVSAPPPPPPPPAPTRPKYNVTQSPHENDSRRSLRSFTDITAVGDPPHWPCDTPLSAKGGTNFADKRRSLGRYKFARGLKPRSYIVIYVLSVKVFNKYETIFSVIVLTIFEVILKKVPHLTNWRFYTWGRGNASVV
jgi:hypothetical protein